MSVNVRVLCRFRPINDRERAEAASGKFKDSTFKLGFPDKCSVSIGNKGASHSFNFDRVFDPSSNQLQVYDESAKQSIQDVLDGYNATIFTYGQTGSGKTFTMFGADTPELLGIVPRASSHIFSYINSQPAGVEFSIKCSFLEIYMENIRDLLNPSKVNLKVRESQTKGIWVDGLTEEFVACEQDIADLIEVGNTARAVSSTGMNQVSSRSHSVFMLVIEQKSEDGSTKRGKLNLVDLAGSEKISKTGAEGQTLEEAKKINQSLSALGNCIHSLTEKGRGHIPYRDSKLTRILQESLGGNCKTTLIITASPHEFNYDETVSTCQFGARAKTIKNQAKVNQQKSVAELMALVQTLTNQLSSLQKYTLTLEKQIAYMRSPDYDPSKPLPAELLAENPVPTLAAPEKSSSSASLENSSTLALEGPGSLSMDPLAVAEQRVAMDRLREQFNSEIDRLKDELAESNQKAEENEKNYLEAKEKTEEVTKKLMSVECELQTQKDMVKANMLFSGSNEKDSQIEELTIKVAELQAQNNMLRTSLASKANARVPTVSETELASLRQKTQEIEEENSLMVEKVAELEEQLAAAQFKQISGVSLAAEESVNQKITYLETMVTELRSQVAEKDSSYRSSIADLKSVRRDLKASSAREGLLEGQLQQVKQNCFSLEQLLMKSSSDSGNSGDLEEAKQIIASIRSLETPVVTLPVEETNGNGADHKESAEDRLERLTDRLLASEDVAKGLEKQLQSSLDVNETLKKEIATLQDQFSKVTEAAQQRYKTLSVELEDLKVKHELALQQKASVSAAAADSTMGLYIPSDDATVDELQQLLSQGQIKLASEEAKMNLAQQRLKEKESKLGEVSLALQELQNTYAELKRDHEAMRLEMESLQKTLLEERHLRQMAQKLAQDQSHINEIMNKRRRIMRTVIRADADPKEKAKVFEEKLDFTQLRNTLKPVRKTTSSMSSKLAKQLGLDPEED